jgi:hypothetical protein
MSNLLENRDKEESEPVGIVSNAVDLSAFFQPFNGTSSKMAFSETSVGDALSGTSFDSKNELSVKAESSTVEQTKKLEDSPCKIATFDGE